MTSNLISSSYAMYNPTNQTGVRGLVSDCPLDIIFSLPYCKLIDFVFLWQCRWHSKVVSRALWVAIGQLVCLMWKTAPKVNNSVRWYDNTKWNMWRVNVELGFGYLIWVGTSNNFNYMEQNVDSNWLLGCRKRSIANLEQFFVEGADYCLMGTWLLLLVEMEVILVGNSLLLLKSFGRSYHTCAMRMLWLLNW